jgi:hypothetical protein
MGKATQAERVLAYMREHPEGITAMEALGELGCFRLAARIYDLRAEGHQITEEAYSTSTAKRVARYRLTGITPTPRTVQSREAVQSVRSSEPVLSPPDPVNSVLNRTKGVQSVGSYNAVLSPPDPVKSVLSHRESVESVPSYQSTAKLRLWVCAQCGAAAAYIGASAAGDTYGIGKCFHHGRTAVMVIHRDVS